MLDLKVLNSVLTQLEEERGIPKDKAIEAIQAALATAYKKEYGKKGQIVRAKFDANTGATVFEQVKIVVDDSTIRFEEDMAEDEPLKEGEERDPRTKYNSEHHIMIDDARLIKKDVELEEELVFPLENKEDFGRIAAQTAKQMIIQKIREAEKSYLSEEFGKQEGEIISGTVQRIERGNIFIDLDRAVGILPFEEQIPGERYRQGERVRAYLYKVEETPRGVFLKLSRSHPTFLFKLIEAESPEVANKTVEIVAIAREAGSRSKVAVYSTDEHVDPVGSLVGQRGVRVSTVMSELGGEKIDVIEWSDEIVNFIEDSLSPAKVISVTIENEEEKRALVMVADDQQSLAIGRGGQNVRLAAKLTGWKIDIKSIDGDKEKEEDAETEDEKTDDAPKDSKEENDVEETKGEVSEDKTEEVKEEVIEEKAEEEVEEEKEIEESEEKVEESEEKKD